MAVTYSPFDASNQADSIEDPVGVFPQAQDDEWDFKILAAGFQNGGVLASTACAVTPQGTPDMTVHVAAGDVMVGGSTTTDIISVTAGNVTLISDGSLPRFAFVVCDDAGALSAVHGTPANSPVFPDAADDTIVLAAVYIPAGATSITASNIKDRRVLLPTPPSPQEGSWQTASKDDDEIRDSGSSGSTLAVDSSLQFTMAANTKYRIRGKLFVTSTTNSGFEWRHVGPASPTLVHIYRNYRNPTTGAIGVEAFDSAYSASDIGVQTGTTQVTFEGIIHNGANAGDFEIWWGQATTHADDTILRGGSYLDFQQA